MYTCSHCKNKSNNSPYICYPNRKKYCSLSCIPDSGMDRPYSFEYFNLVDSIRDIESRIENITTLEDRLNLEEEFEELLSSYALEIYGDDEGLFYKKEISLLISTMDILYNKIHNIFMKRKIKLRPAAVINWYDLTQIIGEDIAHNVFKDFEAEVENIYFENVYCIDPVYNIDINNPQDKLCVGTIKDARNLERLFKQSLNRYKKLLTSEQHNELDLNNYCVWVHKLAQCVVCGEWADWDDFSFDENLKVYQCGRWMDCSKYDDYYKNET